LLRFRDTTRRGGGCRVRRFPGFAGAAAAVQRARRWRPARRLFFRPTRAAWWYIRSAPLSAVESRRTADPVRGVRQARPRALRGSRPISSFSRIAVTAIATVLV